MNEVIIALAILLALGASFTMGMVWCGFFRCQANGYTDWIEWDGGECPVPRHTKVVACRRDGRVMCQLAGDMSWLHLEDERDIVAYIHERRGAR